MSKRQPPDVARLKEMFEVREDGRLVRKIASGKRGKPGDVTGYIMNTGYRATSIDNYPQLDHRIVYAITHGEWPARKIDHINGNRQDNRPQNLRMCTDAQNNFNRKAPCRRNRSGAIGVVRNKDRGTWTAYIQRDGKRRCLGTYNNFDRALKERRKAEVAVFGQFRPLREYDFNGNPINR